ncbi:MAG TPA: tetratricopeptide repeat protein [Blastocatellia bacterium]|nr:tetratricopeptide repeat protein [Blastocatellia bacterium]
MPLLRLFYNPIRAMTDLQARAPYLVGAVLAVGSSFLFHAIVDRSFWSLLVRDRSEAHPSMIVVQLVAAAAAVIPPLIFLAAIFVPACLLAANLIDRRSSFGVLLRQEYAPLASCILFSWAAAHLAMLVPAILLTIGGGVVSFGIAQVLPFLYFIALSTLALRVVLRLSVGRAIGAMAIAAFSLLAIPFVPGVVSLLTSPLLLILVIVFLRSFLGEILGAQRARENLQRNLHAATLNPADSSAHYNLGLIYQQRGQVEEAKTSFRRAIEIDPDEIDAHYQLGRIARAEGRAADAISHFDSVVSREPEHGQGEVWREIGRTYLDAAQYEDALAALERFVDKRPSDAEARYHLGLALHHLGRSAEAAAQMRAVIEAVNTAPAYKYRLDKHWMSQAESFLRSASSG